jgi:hypothetical protein
MLRVEFGKLDEISAGERTAGNGVKVVCDSCANLGAGNIADDRIDRRRGVGGVGGLHGFRKDWRRKGKNQTDHEMD